MIVIIKDGNRDPGKVGVCACVCVYYSVILVKIMVIWLQKQAVERHLETCCRDGEMMESDLRQ